MSVLCSGIQNGCAESTNVGRAAAAKPARAHWRKHNPKSTIHKGKRAVARLIDAYEEGVFSKEEFEPRLRQSNERLATLPAEQATFSQQATQHAELRSIMSHLEEFS